MGVSVVPGGDAVNPDSVRGQLSREGTRDRQHAALRRRIADIALLAEKPEL